jgi:hypothetical protein
MITRRNRLPWVLSWFPPLLAAPWVLQLPQVWQRVHADAGSARESGVRGTPGLVHRWPAARRRLRPGDPGRGPGHRDQAAMTMVGWI